MPREHAYMHDYVCVDGCCTSYDNIITFNTLQSESDKNTTFNRLGEDLNISMLNVCGIIKTGHTCECDLWHTRITCDAIDSNNMMYKTFKYLHEKEKYTEILPEHFKKALLHYSE